MFEDTKNPIRSETVTVRVPVNIVDALNNAADFIGSKSAAFRSAMALTYSHGINNWPFQKQLFLNNKCIETSIRLTNREYIRLEKIAAIHECSISEVIVSAFWFWWQQRQDAAASHSLDGCLPN